MAFKREDVSKLLAKCHRRCCICHKFCGVKMETHHIKSGVDDIENAIPVCFECHAEITLYNDQHPRGRKFLPEELAEHRRQWLELCERGPEMFANPPQIGDVGPLQSLVDEMEFNLEVAKYSVFNEVGCMFREVAFDNIIAQGLLSLLTDDLKASLVTTYRKVRQINTLIDSVCRHTESRGPQFREQWEVIEKQMPFLNKNIKESHKMLITYLARNRD